MRVVELESTLQERLCQLPQLAVAEIVGPWVTGGPAQDRGIDLLLVVDVDDEEELIRWRHEHIDGAFADIERDLARAVEVITFTRGRLQAEARRGAGLLAGIYSQPRVPLCSSLDQILGPEESAALAGRAMSLNAFTEELLAQSPQGSLA